MASKALFTIAAALVIGQSWAGGKFLAAPKINSEDLEADLLAELAASFDNSSTTVQRLSALEDALRPAFAVVPKEGDGTLSHDVVRYVLQRFFSSKHGWFVRGLELGSSNASDAMQEWAPIFLQSLLEKMVTGRGVSLRELAVFAATIEDQVHKEEKSHLLQAYASYTEETSGKLAPKRAFDVIETYMMIYMLAGNWTAEMAEQVTTKNLHMLFKRKVSHWDDTLEWLRELLASEAGAASGLSFEGALHLVARVGDRFASFNTDECGRLKADLLVKESAKPGRVRLVDFYQMSLQGAWEFTEKADFLRDIGALDETDPSTPLVILPNYVQARSNCLAVSDFYAVCCPNECEHLMQHVEANVASSSARPSRIAKIVSGLSSASITAPRKLSKPLMQRLQDVASHHGGEIPLHGRLFAQWMHHAFPRECPYPHAAGTASAQTADEWMLKTGQADSTLTKEEILAEVASDSCRLLPKGVECGHKDTAVNTQQNEEDEELPWDSSEELLVVRQAQPVQPRAGTLRPVRDLISWCALCLIVYGFVWALTTTNVGKRLMLAVGLPLSSSASKYQVHCA